MHSRVSYETVAIRLLYLYSKSCMAIMQHRRITAASMLLKIQNVILWSVFPNPVTYILKMADFTGFVHYHCDTSIEK